MKICIFGLWHLGAVTAACLAERGFSVAGLDFENNIIDGFNKGSAPIFEPDLDESIKKSLAKGTLKFSNDPKAAVGDSDILWITFDTPVDESDNADVDFVFNNIKNILRFLKENSGIIISSQVPVGFTNRIEREIKKISKNKIMHVAYSPENLRLGKAIQAFNSPGRIIIGIRNDIDRVFFEPFFKKLSDNLIWMKVESAEMTKHAINSFLALSVTYINEIASLCEFLGADAKEVEIGLKSEERIGKKAYLKPGAAFAGGTLARDVNFLNTLSKKFHVSSYLLSGINKSNNFHKTWIQRKIKQNFNNLIGKKFLIIGLTYKEGTNTLRRSLSIELIEWLIKQKAKLFAYDPAISSLPEYLSKKVELIAAFDNITIMDCLIIMTEKAAFFNEVKPDFFSIIKNKIIIDANGLIEDKLINSSKMNYFKVGGEIHDT